MNNEWYIDTHIKEMIKVFYNNDGNRKKWSEYAEKLGWSKHPSGKVKPYICEHCECIMTKTGKLPEKDDKESWWYWGDWLTDGEGIRKLHHLSSVGQNTYGTCTSCEELHNSPEWLEDSPADHLEWLKSIKGGEE